MNGNRKGPEDKGSKTGRGMGFCGGFDMPGRENREDSMEVEFGQRRGMGLKRGFGHGRERNSESGMGRGRRGFGCGSGRGRGRGRNNDSYTG